MLNLSVDPGLGPDEQWCPHCGAMIAPAGRWCDACTTAEADAIARSAWPDEPDDRDTNAGA